MPLYNRIIKKLLKKNISISIAESLTGGLLIKVFTDVPGISKIFNMGIVAYSNESKNLFLKVPKTILKHKGAVSQEVSILMSKNLAKISGSDLCISTTGVAGPTGGSQKKPIGLTYITITIFNKKYTFKKKFKGRRNIIQKDTVKFCMNKLKKLI